MVIKTWEELNKQDLKLYKIEIENRKVKTYKLKIYPCWVMPHLCYSCNVVKYRWKWEDMINWMWDHWYGWCLAEVEIVSKY